MEIPAIFPTECPSLSVGAATVRSHRSVGHPGSSPDRNLGVSRPVPLLADSNETGEIDDRREPLQLRKIVALCEYFR
jgi:hypothetical protein